MIAAALAALLAVAAPAAPAAPAVPTASVGSAPVADCPPPKLYPPRFPADMLRAGKSGVAKVRATIDGCGRVLSVELAESSGHRALDDSALEAVSGYVLTPAMSARAVDGVAVLPVRFGRVQTVDLKKPDWPKSHARPRYLADEEPFPFATIAAFQEADTTRGTPALEPPYGASRQKDGGLVVTWFDRDRVDPDTWWLSYTISHPPRPFGRAPIEATGTVAVARYRLGELDGGPVVRLALLCERPAHECDALRTFLMKGLPFARARR